jgi:hypothetical protein
MTCIVLSTNFPSNGASGGSPPASSSSVSSVKPTTTAKPTSTSVSSTKPTSTSSTAPSSGGAAHYAQCGGTGSVPDPPRRAPLLTCSFTASPARPPACRRTPALRPTSTTRSASEWAGCPMFRRQLCHSPFYYNQLQRFLPSPYREQCMMSQNAQCICLMDTWRSDNVVLMRVLDAQGGTTTWGYLKLAALYSPF